MLQFTISAASVSDLREKLQATLNDLSPETNGMVSLLAQAAVLRENPPPIAKTPAEIKEEWAKQSEAKAIAEDMFGAPTPAAEPEKRKRRTKAEIEAEKNKLAEGTVTKTHEPEVVEDAPVVISAKTVSGGPTKEDVHEALQMVNATEGLGITKSREILTHFGAIRISAIKEEQYPLFIKHCQEAVSQIALS